MNQLNLPSFAAKIIEVEGKHKIYDPLRKKYVALTPEEWVRQHFVNYLVMEKNYPKEMIANEVPIKLHNTTKRCDTVLYNKYMEPFMIVEYKAPTVEITQQVFEQILRYDIVLHVKYLVISNGLRHICCEIEKDGQSYRFLQEVPNYNRLSF